MAIRDFSARGGRRIRIAPTVYEPHTRRFKPVKGVGALVNVVSAEEQRRLWRAIEAAIERGEWRLDVDPDSGTADRAGEPDRSVAARPA